MRRFDELAGDNMIDASRKAHRLIRLIVILCMVGALPIAVALVLPLVQPAQSVDFAKVAAVAKLYPDFTLEQHRAVMAEIRSEQHPLLRTLTLAERIKRSATLALRTFRRHLAAAELGSVVNAPFVGNSTFIANPSGNLLALQRQSNCSLSLFDGSFVRPTSTMTPTLQFMQTTANYEQTLHSEAQLTTTADAFPNGCVDPTSGFSNRIGVYLGKTTQGQSLVGWAGFDSFQNTDALYSEAVAFGSTAVQPSTGDYSVPIAALTSGDLNGDGIADVVGIGAAGSIDVWIANANGTLSTHTAYAVPGDTTEAAVVADVNGDGKLDVIVATLDSSTNQEMISVLTGNGDGTLNAAQSVAVATPGHFVIQYIVAADIRSNGRNDLIASNGTVLLNNGSGTFTAGTPAFTPAAGQVVGFGGNLAVADFNKDGKADLAVDDGQEISIYLGHGDGTFTLKTSYVSDTDVGYLTATDLDGDGNIDLYVGTANSGLFGGDEDDEAQAYALMGNGDGTFQGAPVAPFVYTGTNLVPLTAGGVLDAVAQGVDAQGQYTSTFFSYLGDGKGNFTAKTALNPPSGEQFNAYAVGDVTGDGKADLVLVGVNSNTDPSSAGIYVATGDGQGDFATPTYAQVSFDAGNDTAGLTNLQLIDVNHDGKLDAVYMYSYDDLATGINYVGIAAQLGNGDGTFQAPKTLLLYSGTAGSTTTYTLLTSADMNGDGFPDLILMTSTPVANQSPQISYNLALGNGDGTFKAPAPIVTNDVNFAYTTPLAIADMNGDGIPDVVTIGRATAGDFQIAIALGNGNGTFKAANKTNFSVGGESMVAADFNGDGKVDVAILGVFGSEDSGIVFGNGDGTLAPIVTSAGNVFNQALNLQMDLGLSVVADFNGDGKPDILSGTTILLNQPAAAATPTFTLSASSAAASVAPGQSATTTLTLTPSGGFDASVALTCSGLPAGAVCTFSPATVSVNGSAVTDTLTISTSAATANVLTPWTTGGMMLAGILLPFAVQRRARSLPLESSQASMAHITWLLLGALLLASCHSGGGSGGTSSGGSSSGGSSSSGSSSGGSSSGGGSSGGSGGTIAGTYHVTITATAGSMTHTLAYTLTVS
jgi:hypothetical protein